LAILHERRERSLRDFGGRGTEIPKFFQWKYVGVFGSRSSFVTLRAVHEARPQIETSTARGSGVNAGYSTKSRGVQRLSERPKSVPTRPPGRHTKRRWSPPCTHSVPTGQILNLRGKFLERVGVSRDCGPKKLATMTCAQDAPSRGGRFSQLVPLAATPNFAATRCMMEIDMSGGHFSWFSCVLLCVNFPFFSQD
jgi:hypothetical protein